MHMDTSKDRDKCQNHNVQSTSNNFDYPIINDSIITENKMFITEEDITCNNNDKNFKNAIATWVISHNIPHNACNALLKILCQYTSCDIPMDARTLLKTPRQTNILQICGGEYFYFGLQDIIKKMLLKNNEKCLNLILNIDGLPLAKSPKHLCGLFEYQIQ